MLYNDKTKANTLITLIGTHQVMPVVYIFSIKLVLVEVLQKYTFKVKISQIKFCHIIKYARNCRSIGINIHESKT